jgi:transmembrane sensor
MPFDDMEWIRLAQYWAGECDAAESAAIEAWLNADPERRTEALAMRQVWEASRLTEAGSVGKGDADRTWNAIQSRLGARRDIAQRAPARVRVERFDRTTASRRTWALPGAIAAVVVGAAVLAYTVDASRRGPSALDHGREYVTAPGQSETVRLADGTEFMLAPGSRLQLGAEYGDARRDVVLQGEATFTVVHDSRRPFVVRVGRAIATDIGTRFDVRGYADDSSVRVVVAEGQVGVGRLGASQQAPLGRGDMATIGDSSVAIVHGVDVNGFLGWSSGRFVFDQVPLSSAAIELARWYGVTIVIGDSTMRARHVSITLERQSLTSALDVIALAVGARVVRQGSTFTLITANRPTAHPL